MTRLPIITLAAAMLCQPVVAESISVSTRGLDLTSIKGRAVLDRRIGIAARQVCGVNGTVVLSERIASQRCVAIARNEARTRVAGRYGKPDTAKAYAEAAPEKAGWDRPAYPSM